MRARNASASATAAFMGTSLALLAVPAPARAQDIQPYEGFLCCNLHRKGSWISDWTDFDKGPPLVAAGTPVKVSGCGRWRVRVEIDG